MSWSSAGLLGVPHPALRVNMAGHYLTANYEDIVQALHDHDVWAFMSNPLIIPLSILLFLLFALKRSSKGLAFLGAAWGYGIIYHFTLGMGKVEYDVFAGNAQQGLPQMLSFFGGIFLVTVIALYFVVKGN